ncbi:MAG TPA: hypothetical protein VK540_06560 [Polyangiaceae bacterium]|nr:hypothetical protein [Polyangiaceae bacterium]
MRLKTSSALPWIIFVAAVPVMSGCALKNQIEDAASGCNEFEAGGDAVGSLSIDGKVKAFAQAAAELKQVGDGIKADVKLACVNIAKDLGETDRWSADNADTAISNSGKTGACDVAAGRIDAILTAASADLGANFALQVSGGECTVDAEAQASCEATCQTDVTCTEGSVEVRCPPAELSVQCEGECKAEATCEGRADVETECTGKCEAECAGTCDGELHGKTEGGCEGICEGKCDSMATGRGGMANCMGTCEGRCTKPHPKAMCHGKCSSKCEGKCKGKCKIDASASVKCSAGVSCKGGCTGTVSQPKCETEITPPVCKGDTSCQSSCSAHASAKVTCTPQSISLVFNLDPSGDLAKLKATIEANLPAVLLTFKTKGQLAQRALQKVAATGQAVVDASGKLGGKALACAGTAADASIKASASMSVSVSASASVSTSCVDHSS